MLLAVTASCGGRGGVDGSGVPTWCPWQCWDMS